MKYSLTAVCFVLLTAFLYFGFSGKKSSSTIITVSTFGKQPTVTIDKANNVKVVFGQGEEIFYTISKDLGKSFTSPQRIGKQTKLALGMTRGPQITTTKDFTIVAAADHTGKIMVYRLKNNKSKWSQPVNILNSDTTAKEGFIALASGKDNVVYAAWLDMRIADKNNIFSSYSLDGGKTWSKSKLVYKAPEGGICPCCRPSITADQKGNVYVMFRNELKGSRDMYVAHSKDSGKTFSPAQKLGLGTWTLKACPMDGGAIAMDASSKVGTSWRRENTIYYAEPGSLEQKIAEGKASSLVKTLKGNYIVWQQGNNIMSLPPGKIGPEVLGTGIYPRLATLLNQQVLSVWEKEGKIVAKILP
ncbi:exo-alpha-sialidase (plasmid) [Adhaeribacter swui]|uniref:Exo-alpha-sialidase n=1 Tax=Adhaeribacter swui TaxID=2086471 RepID=A0A7G7G2A2_9BACT|nr:sialidase family protein [Adhaeribacter swui]QNF31286.1 exo-alpha-sialidase [Adhaeribacter swui]